MQIIYILFKANFIIMSNIIEKHSEFNKETHRVFIDFGKTFDPVDRSLLWWELEERGYSQIIETI